MSHQPVGVSRPYWGVFTDSDIKLARSEGARLTLKHARSRGAAGIRIDRAAMVRL